MLLGAIHSPRERELPLRVLYGIRVHGVPAPYATLRNAESMLTMRAK